MTRQPIYTRDGDDGTTGLFYGGRVPKDSELPRAYGTVDEAQAVLGLARSAAANNGGDARVVAREVLGPSADDAARSLYAALHAMDAAQCSHVLLEAPPATADWEAVADRLRRAAAPSDAPTSA